MRHLRRSPRAARSAFAGLAASAFLGLLAGCASAVPPAIGPGPLRLIVKARLVETPGDALVAAAREASGREVRHLSEIGDGLHALWLACGDAADCRASFERIEAARSVFAGVWVDARKRIVSPAG